MESEFSETIYDLHKNQELQRVLFSNQVLVTTRSLRLAMRVHNLQQKFCQQAALQSDNNIMSAHRLAHDHSRRRVKRLKKLLRELKSLQAALIVGEVA